MLLEENTFKKAMNDVLSDLVPYDDYDRVNLTRIQEHLDKMEIEVDPAWVKIVYVYGNYQYINGREDQSIED